MLAINKYHNKLLLKMVNNILLPLLLLLINLVIKQLNKINK